MEKNFINIDFTKIEDMVEDDAEFRNQLLNAIVTAVEELESTYVNGIDAKDTDCVKQARHKIKPTLGLFGLKRLSHILSNGKKLMAEDKFDTWADTHKEELKLATRAVVEEVRDYRDF